MARDPNDPLVSSLLYSRQHRAKLRKLQKELRRGGGALLLRFPTDERTRLLRELEEGDVLIERCRAMIEESFAFEQKHGLDPGRARG
jgi:hypothetical protein